MAFYTITYPRLDFFRVRCNRRGCNITPYNSMLSVKLVDNATHSCLPAHTYSNLGIVLHGIYQGSTSDQPCRAPASLFLARRSQEYRFAA